MKSSAFIVTLRYAVLELKTFSRNTSSIIFTGFLPIMFFILWATLNKSNSAEVVARFLIPSSISWIILTNTIVQLGIQIPILRETRVLKRLKGTPLSPSVYFSARILVVFLLIALQSIAIFALGSWLLKSVDVSWLQLAIAILVNTLFFAIFGVALANLIPNGHSAPAIANAVFFPMLFLNGAFFSLENAPWILRILHLINPSTYTLQLLRNLYQNKGFGLNHSYGWAVLAAWFLVSLYIAVFHFRWESRR